MGDSPPRSFPLPDSSSDSASNVAGAPEGASDPAPSADAPAQTTPLSDDDLAALPDAYCAQIEHLHARVEQAARIIKMLQRENARLQNRVEELARRPEVPEGHTLLTVEEPPDALRSRLEQYLDAIDRYLDSDAPAAWNAESPEENASA